MMGENVILIGLPTAGKSTVGVVLAKQLGYDYIDTDLLIQQQEGCRLEETIREKGEEAFLDIEAGVCSALQRSRTVIATGGIAKFIVPLCNREMIYDKDLIVKGLVALYKENIKRKG